MTQARIDTTLEEQQQKAIDGLGSSPEVTASLSTNTLGPVITSTDYTYPYPDGTMSTVLHDYASTEAASTSSGLADMVAYIIETQEIYEEGICQIDAGIVNNPMSMDILGQEINDVLIERSVPVRVEVGGFLHRVRKDDAGVFTRHSVLRFRIRDVTLLEMAKGE